jgi:hypothetical protein
MLENEFPGLRTTSWAVTSPATKNYNCIAWAAGDTGRWWEPDPLLLYFWPPQIPRRYDIDAYAAAYGVLGFQICDDAVCEPGFEKLAIFVGADGRPTHAARQLANGSWTSKLGPSEDIEHETVDSLAGQNYGHAAVFLKRRLNPNTGVQRRQV